MFISLVTTTVSDDNTFILTTDADVKFQPESVEALLDLMTRDQHVGAVCSRTHPMGSGPIYWFQIFDYAIGHWLQKVHTYLDLTLTFDWLMICDDVIDTLLLPLLII